MKIVITDCNHGNTVTEFSLAEKSGHDIAFADLEGDISKQDVLDACADADIIITQRAEISGDMIDLLPCCKVVTRYGVGVDNLEVSAIEDRGIKVVHFPDFCTEEVANHSLSLIMHAYRKLDVIFSEDDLSSCWGMPAFLGGIQSSRDTVVGIIGMGKIGSAVADRLISCGFTVIGFDPYVKNYKSVRMTDMDSILAGSDIITVHCPLNNETENMISIDSFSRMKKDSVIVNTSRGRVINQKDLERALESGTIRAAFIDVCDPEPPYVGSYSVPNLYITPHVAFYSERSLNNLKEGAIRKSLEALDAC